MVSIFIMVFLKVSTSSILIITGTRPPLPAIQLGKEYDNVLELFYVCTTMDYKHRPSAIGLVRYFENYVYEKKV